MPLFSVIIPTYNRADLLTKALHSVFCQDFKDFEVIVVDDGSDDNVADAIAPYRSTVTLLRQPNSGAGAARNHGAEKSQGSYLAFLDSDDFWFPWTLRVFATLIEMHNGPALLTGRLIPFENEAELSGVCESPASGHLYSDYLECNAAHCCVGAGTAVVRRDAFIACGGFDQRPMNMEDHDLSLRLGTAAGFLAVLSPITLACRRHSGSVTHNVFKTYLGARNLIERETRGIYPGGNDRSYDRRRIITVHTRSASLECLRSQQTAEAWWVFWRTLRWNFLLRRWKYVFAFPVVWLAKPRRGRRTSRQESQR